MPFPVSDGFDTYNGLGANTGLAARYALVDTANLSLVTGHSGSGQAVRITANPADPRLSVGFSGSPLNDFIFGFSVRFTVMPTADRIIPDAQPYSVPSNTTGGSGVGFDTDGSVWTYANGIKNRSAAGVIVLNAINYIEYVMKAADSGGVVEVWVNNVKVLDLAGDTRANDALAFASGMSFGRILAFSSDGTRDYDNAYIKEGLVRIGPQIIEYLQPNANVGIPGWTPLSGTNWGSVDDVPNDGGTTYVSASATNVLDLYDVIGLAGTPTSITFVKPLSVAQKLDGVSRTLMLPIKHGATQSDGAALGLPQAAYGYLSGTTHETNPDTGVAWTVGDIAGVQVGLKSQ